MMEREETKKIAGGMAELPDEELDQVSGGYDTYDKFIGKKFYPGLWGGNTVEKNVCKRYKWECGDINLKYRCPNCGRLVHKGSWNQFYCDPCNESWFFEDYLDPNLDAWVFKEIVELKPWSAEDMPTQ